MKVILATDKNAWQTWHTAHHEAEFLQSWEWGTFQASVGNTVIRMQVVEHDAVIAQVQGFVHRLCPGMEYVYLPRVRGEYLNVVCEYLKGKGHLFVRVEPTQRLKIKNLRLRVQQTHSRSPQHTLLVDLSESEEYLMQEMHSKTRYNIRLSERKGVQVRQGKNVDVFWELNEQTTGRDGFRSHRKDYYEKMLLLDHVFQFTAYVEGKPIASNICIGYGNTFTYLHGASGNIHRNLMAPYLLQWDQILFAKERRYVVYDFWGIAPPANGSTETTFHTLSWKADDSWTGITRFKAGFGGERREYPGAVEVVLRPWLYWTYKKIRNMMHEARNMRQKKHN